MDTKDTETITITTPEGAVEAVLRAPSMEQFNDLADAMGYMEMDVEILKGKLIEATSNMERYIKDKHKQWLNTYILKFSQPTKFQKLFGLTPEPVTMEEAEDAFKAYILDVKAERNMFFFWNDLFDAFAKGVKERLLEAELKNRKKLYISKYIMKDFEFALSGKFAGIPNQLLQLIPQ